MHLILIFLIIDLRQQQSQRDQDRSSKTQGLTPQFEPGQSRDVTNTNRPERDAQGENIVEMRPTHYEVPYTNCSRQPDEMKAEYEGLKNEKVYSNTAHVYSDLV